MLYYACVCLFKWSNLLSHAYMGTSPWPILRHACLNVLDIHELSFASNSDSYEIIYRLLSSISDSYEIIYRTYASIPNSYENIIKFMLSNINDKNIRIL